MKKNKTFLFAAVLFSITMSRLNAQTDNAPKIVLITLDGFRWQELFNGADKDLIANDLYVEHPEQLKNIFLGRDCD